jgi:hypothetical protein
VGGCLFPGLVPGWSCRLGAWAARGIHGPRVLLRLGGVLGCCSPLPGGSSGTATWWRSRHPVAVDVGEPDLRAWVRPFLPGDDPHPRRPVGQSARPASPVSSVTHALSRWRRDSPAQRQVRDDLPRVMHRLRRPPPRQPCGHAFLHARYYGCPRQERTARMARQAPEKNDLALLGRLQPRGVYVGR